MSREAPRLTLGSPTAGQGFEPQLPGPEPGVLPLDDPATGARSLARRGRGSLRLPDLEPYVEVVARIDTEAEKRLVPVYRLEIGEPEGPTTTTS